MPLSHSVVSSAGLAPRHGAEIAIWIRWLVLVVWLAEVAYRVDDSESSYILNTLYKLPPMAINGCVHYRIQTNRTVTWFWLLALSLTQLQHREETALAICDESVLAKPEGIAPGGLCPVRASKAARLKRIKPGFCHSPGGPPVFVPKMQRLTVMMAET